MTFKIIDNQYGRLS